MCSVESCPAETPIAHLMCGRHWFMVPAAMKTEVNDAYAAFRRTVPKSGQQYRKIGPKWDRAAWKQAGRVLEAAQQRATAHVEARLAERAR